MKKMFIITAFAVSCYSAVFGACSETVLDKCYLWDVSFTLKTLAPKAAKCGGAKSVCGEAADPAYYMDGATRKLKGYIWSCEYSCDTWNIVLWDEKNKTAVIPLDVSGENQATVSAEDAFIYGKKATKACATFAIADPDGENIDITACGMNGTLTRKDGEFCYVKSLSGRACGNLAYIHPNTYKVTRSGGGLCGEAVEDLCGDEFTAKCLTWCDACCFTSWCEDGEEAPELLPCEGTWKMKFNKKLASGKKGSIYDLVPAYAR